MSRPPLHRLEQQVARTVRAHDLLRPGARLLVAVSGGPDSMALLHVLIALAPRWALHLSLGHFNHRLRGAESAADEDFVVDLASRLGLPLHLGHAGETLVGAAIEARARKQRYAFLLQAAAQGGWQHLATGHTLDDQAETVLMRLLRGSGSAGLSAIRPRRGAIVRPLLDVSRREVMDYLQQHGLAYRTDASNSDQRFLRNRVRHAVLPVLEQLQPQVRRTLARTADLARRDGRWLDQLAHRRLARVCTADGSLDLTPLVSQPEPVMRRILFAWLSQRGLMEVAAQHVDALVQLVGGAPPAARGVTLPGGWVARRRGGRLGLESTLLAIPIAAAEPVLLPPDGALDLAGGWSISCASGVPVAADHRPQAACECRLDAAVLPGPLMVRYPRPGDRMRPLGLGGRKKLQDLFVDQHVPRGERATWPVVECGGEILWVAGIARSAVALVGAATAQILRVQVQRSGVAGVESLC